MIKWIGFIGAGSFLGGISRFLISYYTQPYTYKNFPLGTLIVNILGCFLIGLFFEMAVKNNWSEEMKFFLMTGFLGGLTTFSTFSLESVVLFKSQHYAMAITYVFLSIALGSLAVGLGFHISKYIH